MKKVSISFCHYILHFHFPLLEACFVLTVSKLEFKHNDSPATQDLPQTISSGVPQALAQPAQLIFQGVLLLIIVAEAEFSSDSPSSEKNDEGLTPEKSTSLSLYIIFLILQFL